MTGDKIQGFFLYTLVQQEKSEYIVLTFPV